MRLRLLHLAVKRPGVAAGDLRLDEPAHKALVALQAHQAVALGAGGEGVILVAAPAVHQDPDGPADVARVDLDARRVLDGQKPVK